MAMEDQLFILQQLGYFIIKDTLPCQKEIHNFDSYQQIVVLWSGVASVGQV